MTTLDLNAYGVTEMSHAEKVENDGGIIEWIALGLTILCGIGYVVDNREKAAEGFEWGLEDGRNFLNN